MGNNSSISLLDNRRYTKDFASILQKTVDRRAEGATEEEKQSINNAFRDAVTLFFYFASNLRSQWFSNPRVLKEYENGEWRAAPIQSVHDGVYAIVLIYAAKGMFMSDLVMLPHIFEELQKHGLRPAQVCWIADLNSKLKSLGHHFNDWLLEELELKSTLTPVGLELHERVKLCGEMVEAAKQWIKEKHKEENLSRDLPILQWITEKHEEENLSMDLPILTAAISHAANTCFSEDTTRAERYYLDLTGREDVKNIFYVHYHVLSGGRCWVSESAGDRHHPHCWKAGVVAAVFCSIVLAEGEEVDGLASDPLFSNPANEDSRATETDTDDDKDWKIEMDTDDDNKDWKIEMDSIRRTSTQITEANCHTTFEPWLQNLSNAVDKWGVDKIPADIMDTKLDVTIIYDAQLGGEMDSIRKASKRITAANCHRTVVPWLQSVRNAVDKWGVDKIPDDIKNGTKTTEDTWTGRGNFIQPIFRDHIPQLVKAACEVIHAKKTSSWKHLYVATNGDKQSGQGVPEKNSMIAFKRNKIKFVEISYVQLDGTMFTIKTNNISAGKGWQKWIINVWVILEETYKARGNGRADQELRYNAILDKLFAFFARNPFGEGAAPQSIRAAIHEMQDRLNLPRTAFTPPV